MASLNRIKEYYDVAVEYLSLPFDARVLIGCHFKVFRNTSIDGSNQTAIDEEVFREVFNRDIFEEFK